MPKRSRVAAVVTLAALAGAACSNAGSGDDRARDGSGGERPGVTDDEIRVGGVASVTNPLGNPVESVFEGAKAYFERLNDGGGVHGRRVRLVSERDDNSQASRNAAQVRALVEQDRVFAVLPVAVLSFAGADYLAENAVPTFGWNIQAEWQRGPTLFGQRGSYTCFDCPSPVSPWLVREAGFERPGIIAYNVPQSRGCADGFRNSLDEFGPASVFEDTSIPFGAVDLSADIDRLREAEVDFLFTCMDANGSATVAKAIRDADLDVPLYLPNGYDHEFVEENAAVLEGSYVGVQFAPFERAGDVEALATFLDAMEERKQRPNELALVGWVVADMFTTGVRAAGEDFDRRSVVAAVNSLRDFDAGGIIPPVDWTLAHDGPQPEACFSYLRVEAGELVPKFGDPDKPFVCFGESGDGIPEPAAR